MYFIGNNLYQNANTKRHRFYSELLQFAAHHGRMISIDEVVRIGVSLGYTPRYVHDELIGCLYANFLTETESGYRITDRALRDFPLYDSETVYKTAEIPYRISFRPNDIKLSYFHLAGMPFEVVEKHKAAKWRWNRSLMRVMCRCDSIEKVNQAILTSVSIFDPFLKLNAHRFADFLEIYGKRYKRSAIYSADVNFRGLFQSDSVEPYASVYLELKERCINPVDWGGNPFYEDYIAGDPAARQEFLAAALADGMIRRIDNRRYSLTGFASLVINGIKKRFHETRLSVILRKKQDSYSLWLGGNSQYPRFFTDYIADRGLACHDGWFVRESYASLEEIYTAMTDILNFFALHVARS